MNAKTRYSILYSLGLAALFILALAIVTNQIYNYFQFRTTIIHKTENATSFPFPSVSFCPGFGSNLDEDFPWLLPRNRFDLFRVVDNFPRTKIAAKKLWKESTFDAKDFIKWVEITYANETSDTLSLGREGNCFEIKQLDTLSGKCYTFTLNCSAQVITCTMLGNKLTYIINFSE